MKTRVCKPSLDWNHATVTILAIALLLSGCSRSLNPYSSSEPATSSKPQETVLPQGQSKGYTDAETKTEKEISTSESERTIMATVENEQLTLSTQQLSAGKAQVKISNQDTDTLDVLILQTDLPVEHIPIKDGRVDFSTGTVKLIAKLDNSPLPIFGSDTIFCDLETGNYVIMIYPTGKIYNAMKQPITVNATSEI